jgi:hypothetical protein
VTTWNPSDAATNFTFSNGNLTVIHSTASASGVRGTTSYPSGDKYFEIVFGSVNTSAGVTSGVGIGNASANLNSYLGSDFNGLGYHCNGKMFGSSTTTGLATCAAGDVIGIEVLSSSSLKWWKNGSLITNPTALPTGTLFPMISLANNTTDTLTVNFGATSLSFLPSGASAWDSAAPTVTFMFPRSRHYVRR